MKKRSCKSNIILCFTLLNVLCMLTFLVVVDRTYFYKKLENIRQSNGAVLEMITHDLDDMAGQINELTLNIYGDRELSGLLRTCRDSVGIGADGVRSYPLMRRMNDSLYRYLEAYPFVCALFILQDVPWQRDFYAVKYAQTDMRRIMEEYAEKQYARVLGHYGAAMPYLTRDALLLYSRPLRDYADYNSAEPLGTVSVAVSVSYLQEMLAKRVLDEMDCLFLLDPDGNISYSTDRALNGQNAFALGLKQERPAAGIEAFDGRDVVAMERPVEGLDRTLVALVSIERVYSAVSAFRLPTLVAIFILLTLNFLMVIVLGNNISRPIGSLIRQMQGLAEPGMQRRIRLDSFAEFNEISAHFNELLDSIQALVRENYLIKINEKNARIAALQSQINPHFINNTLETINWQVRFSNVPQVCVMITSLGEMLRYTTYGYGSFVTLEQEMRQIENYLTIQKARFDDNFEWEIRLGEGLKELKIPCLLVQPIVENAVVHGLYGVEKGGIVRIATRSEGEAVDIVIYDNGRGIEERMLAALLPGSAEGESIGCRNTHERIRLTYGEAYGIAIRSEVGAFTEVTLHIGRKPLGGGKQDDPGIGRG